MSEARLINQGIEDGIMGLLTHLMDSERVKGVFSLVKTNEEGAVSYSLITNADELKRAVPFQPLMPVNAGRVLSMFTQDGQAPAPIAAVVRPCELRAFIELVKREQAHRDNILLISLTCGGVFPLNSLAEQDFDGSVRLTCRSCEEFVPEGADIIFAAAGEEKNQSQCVMHVNTELGSRMAAEAPGRPSGEKLINEAVKDLQRKRHEENTKAREDYEKNRKSHEALIKTFTACLGCHACQEVCPICNCRFCTFDSKTSEYHPENLGSDLKHKGGMKVPTGNIFFHLGRMSHMAVSCVKCGMCSDVCPVRIPVADVFSRVGESLQEVFQYDPGRNVEEPVPSGSYKEDEFAQVGEQ